MKYTILIDCDYSKDDLQNMFRLWAESNLIALDSLTPGDETNTDFFSVIRWHEDDIAVALENRNITSTQDNIEMVKQYSGVLEDRSVEEGWEILDIIISDIEYDNGFDGAEKQDEINFRKESNQ